jgi:hypothetical protein
MGVAAKLSWGLLYGLGFGAGIGYAFNKLQCAEIDSAAPPQTIHLPPASSQNVSSATEAKGPPQNPSAIG